MKHWTYCLLALGLIVSLMSSGPVHAFAPAIGADASGGVYVLDAFEGVLLKFDESGKVTAKWTPSEKDDYSNSRAVMAVGRDGHVYVGNHGECQVLDLGLSLKLVKGWKVKGFRLGPDALTVDSKGNVYAVGSSVVKLSPAGQRLSEWRDGKADIHLASAVALDPKGNVYVATKSGIHTDIVNDKTTETEVKSHIVKFDPSGRRVRSWESGDKNGGRFSDLVGIAFDSAGNMYATGFLDSTVQKFDKTGKRVLEWELEDSPSGIAVGRKDRIYVVGHFSKTVVVFNTSGKRLDSWPLPEDKSEN